MGKVHIGGAFSKYSPGSHFSKHVILVVHRRSSVDLARRVRWKGCFQQTISLLRYGVPSWRRAGGAGNRSESPGEPLCRVEMTGGTIPSDSGALDDEAPLPVTLLQAPWGIPKPPRPCGALPPSRPQALSPFKPGFLRLARCRACNWGNSSPPGPHRRRCQRSGPLAAPTSERAGAAHHADPIARHRRAAGGWRQGGLRCARPRGCVARDRRAHRFPPPRRADPAPVRGRGRRATVAEHPACTPRSRAQTPRPSGARPAAWAHTCPAAAARSPCRAAVSGIGGSEGEGSRRRRGPPSGGSCAWPEASDPAARAPPHHGPEAAAPPLPVLRLARAVSGAGAPHPRRLRARREGGWGRCPPAGSPGAPCRRLCCGTARQAGEQEPRGSRPASHLSHLPLDATICVSQLGGCSLICSQEYGGCEVNGLFSWIF